jgi:hypothetical protein
MWHLSTLLITWVLNLRPADMLCAVRVHYLQCCVIQKMTALWGTAPRSLVEYDRHFRDASCLHHNGYSHSPPWEPETSPCVTLFGEKLSPDMRKHVLLICRYLAASIAVSNCSAEWRTSRQELRRVLLMNTWRDSWESQQQKLNPTLKDYSSKSSAKYLTNDWFCQRKLLWTCL